MLFFLPWTLRRPLLQKFLSGTIHRTSRIGFSLIDCEHINIGSSSSIGHLNFFRSMARLEIGTQSRIGNLNWVSGQRRADAHFLDEPERDPSLIIGNNSAITHRHLIDCTNTVSIEDFTTFAGWGSQVLSHSIDLELCRQRSAPVKIGSYCFIGTRCTLLKGSTLPSYSVLAAGAVISQSFTQEFSLYGGVPAKFIQTLETDMGYFTRSSGFVQ